MSDRIETVIAEALHACGVWKPEVVEVPDILAALKAARIAVVELPEVSQEDLYHQYWISIAPNASIKYEYDGSWDSSEHVREFATALLAAADIAEASQ